MTLQFQFHQVVFRYKRDDISCFSVLVMVFAVVDGCGWFWMIKDDCACRLAYLNLKNKHIQGKPGKGFQLPEYAWI